MKSMQSSEEIIEKGLDTTEETAGSSDSRVYEVGYILVPTVREEDVAALYSNIKDLVSSLGGEAIADEMPRMTQLAYSMVKVVSNIRSKFNTGYFGWTKFSMDAGKVADLKKKLDLDPNILRYIIIKTVRENTIAAKRFVGRDLHKKPAKKEGEEAQPINKEELDQEIDAMVSA